MESGLGGPAITALASTAGFDVETISAYITRVLQLVDKQDAYGILAGVHQHGGPLVPTFIFGIPGYEEQQVVLPPSPNNMPVWIRDDRVLSMNELDTAWAMDEVLSLGELTLAKCSLGLESIYDFRSVPLLG